MNNKIKSITQDIIDCEECTIRLSCTKPVPGSGNSDAMILIVGQNPGSSEDKIGKPFVGSSGIVLDYCLNEAGINRDDIFITNAVKCLTPRNRPPKMSEISNCRQHLFGELNTVEPLITVLMGRIACIALEFRRPMNELINIKLKRNKKTYIPSWHPASTFYSPNKKEVIIRNLKLAKKITR